MHVAYVLSIGLLSRMVISPLRVQIVYVYNDFLMLKQGEEQNLALAMSSYWINFAKTGDPSSDLSPTKWPLFTVENDEVLRFDTTSDRGIHIQSGLRKKQCDYQEINRFGSMGHKTL